MDTAPYWLTSHAIPTFPKREKNLHVDVVVVGGGITGITAAYLLKKAGHKVALLERDRCVHGDTGHTTAHLTSALDRRFQDLVRDFGGDDAQAIWDAGRAAILQIHHNIQKEQLDCDFAWVPAYLHAPLSRETTEDDVALLQKEALLIEEHFLDAIYVNEVPLFYKPGVRVANQAMFHPAKYLQGLLAQIPGNGSHVYEKSEAQEFNNDPLQVKANGHTIDCDHVVTPPRRGSHIRTATLRHANVCVRGTDSAAEKNQKDRPEARRARGLPLSLEAPGGNTDGHSRRRYACSVR